MNDDFYNTIVRNYILSMRILSKQIFFNTLNKFIRLKKDEK